MGDPYDESIKENDDDDEEFCSCVTEEDQWGDPVEPAEEYAEDVAQDDDLKIFFKGLSTPINNDLITRISGIGVVLDRASKVISRHKKLDFYVEEPLAELLALMDGLLEALKTDVRRVFAYTDSEIVYNQISQGRGHSDQLLAALSERILEHAGKLEIFILKLVPTSELEMPLKLAEEAIGKSWSLEDCSICCKKKLEYQMVALKCSHKFCSCCLVNHINLKLATSEDFIKCPNLACNHYISTSECKSVLPTISHEALERFMVEGKSRCPYPNCSVLFNVHQCISSASTSSQNEPNCVECPECRRLICANCSLPSHSSMGCQEHQNLHAEENNVGSIGVHLTEENQQWRQCRICMRMIELTQGCQRMTCWCGHEFCYSCGAEYQDGEQTCQCAFWDDVSFEDSTPGSTGIRDIEPWLWDSFHSLSTFVEGYTDQERSNLALIQKFLAGGFDQADHLNCETSTHCSDSYNDAMKDLHQLPWLERFVSVINDDYFEDYLT